MNPKRDCREFPAYDAGPADFYRERKLLRAPRSRKTTVSEAQRPVQTRHRVMAIPRFDPAMLAYAQPCESPASRRAREIANAYRPPQAPIEASPSGDISEHPALVGLALLVMPPVGVALLWASPRFNTAGKVAVTAFTTFAVALVTALFLR